MEPKKAYKSFRYQSGVRWDTGRRALVQSPGKHELKVSSPPEFKGDAGLWTPEEMFVASVNACTLMTFIAFAQHKGLEFLGYECNAEGLLENVEGKYRFTEITLHPLVRVKSEQEVDRAREVLHEAHAECFISNSISAPVKLLPEIRVG